VPHHEIYSDAVWTHYRHPCHAGRLNAEAPDVGTGQVGTQAEGAVLRLQIQVDDAGVIRDTRFKAYGCGTTIAAGSLAAQRLQGCTLDQAQTLESATFIAALSLPPVKQYCAMLVEDAIRAAIRDYRQKRKGRCAYPEWQPDAADRHETSQDQPQRQE